MARPKLHNEITKNCLYCNKEFITFPRRIKIGAGKFCCMNCVKNSRKGRKCSEELKLKMKKSWELRPRKILVEKECKNFKCKKIFKTSIKRLEQGRGKFCSRKCLALNTASHRDSKIKKQCPSCKKSFKIWPYQLKNIQKNFYCSTSCRSKLTHLREQHYKWIEDRTKVKGDNNSQERRSLQYGNWRKEIWLRDNFKCRIANENCKGRIEAHHILGWTEYPELRYQINNGITLCQAHHPRKRAEEKRLSPYFQELVSVSKE